MWLNAARLKVKEATLRRDGVVSHLRVVPGGDDFVGFRADAPLAAGPRISTSSSRAPSRVATTRASSPCRKRTPGTSSPSSRRSRRAAPSRASTSPASRSPGVTLRVPHGAVALATPPPPSTTAEDGARRRVAFARDAAAAELPGRVRRSGRSTWSTSRRRAASTCRPGSSCRRGAAPRTPPGRASRRRASSRCSRSTSTAPTPTTSSTRSRSPAAGFAMEHPGLVTYGQTLMVQRPATRRSRPARGWASVAAHELAHQWFGDLVTMAWWDDTWLNESFASWLGEKVTDRFRPEWGVAIERACEPVERAATGQRGERAPDPPADHVEGRHRQRLRRRDLRQGRGRAGDGRGLAGRGRLPPAA